MEKILAVASIGGHWVQLLRIARPLMSEYEVIFASTHDKCKDLIGEEVRFYKLIDFNRKNAKLIIPSLKYARQIIMKEKPTAIITTGAAPGLVLLAIGKMMGVKTIWIDSIANVEKLSFSGKIASYFADYTLTQWKHLERDGVYYFGNILG